MSFTKNVLSSSVGKKVLLGFSGVGLLLFIIMHLLGNLTLLSSSNIPFNSYVAQLAGLGSLLIFLEIGLAFVFLLHIFLAVQLTLLNRASRKNRYEQFRSKGRPSYWNLSSVNMIITGAVLLGFLIYHVLQFRFGPGVDQGYVTTLNGQDARDLHRLVIEIFQNPLHVFIYVFSMIFLGFHLRHGFWSAFQSLGLQYPNWSRAIYMVGVMFAIFLAVGFILIPVWLYLKG